MVTSPGRMLEISWPHQRRRLLSLHQWRITEDVALYSDTSRDETRASFLIGEIYDQLVYDSHSIRSVCILDTH